MNLRFNAALILSFIIAGCGSGGGSSSSTDVTPGNNNTLTGGCFTSFTTVGGSNTTISGKIQYVDKEYGISGFTGKTTYKAVRYAEVEIVDSARPDTTLVPPVFTNSSGLYRIPPMTFDNVTSAYLRVYSNTVDPNKPIIKVYNLSNYLYAVRCNSNFKPQTGTSVTTNLDIPSPAAGAFNIMDVFTSAGEFLMSLGVASSNLGTLNAFWQGGADTPPPGGTYYKSSNAGIYVRSVTGVDTDEYDDDVLWHEYGHFAADKFSRDDSQGGYHYIGQDTLDLRLAWSEGWGEFFPSAVKEWLNANKTSLLSIPNAANISKYVDTPSGVFFDLAAPGENLYSSNEVSVGAVLWNTMIATGINGIWDVFTDFTSGMSPISLETFWDVWQAKPYADLTTYFIARQIYYQPDICELDNASGAARGVGSCNGNVRYLYGSSDVDFFSFNATGGTSYTIETYDLKNGADTYLTLFGTDGSTRLSWNDNWINLSSYATCDAGGACPPNNTMNLSSKITPWIAPANGTYYVKVNTSASRPPSAGRYGTYSLRITPTP